MRENSATQDRTSAETASEPIREDRAAAGSAACSDEALGAQRAGGFVFSRSMRENPDQPRTVAENSVRPWDRALLQDRRYAAQCWFNLTSNIPGVRALREDFWQDVRAAAPIWLKTSNRQAFVAAMNRTLPNAGLRQRDRDDSLPQRRARLAAEALKLCAPIENTGHKKGAGYARSWMDLRASLRAIYDTPDFKALMLDVYGDELGWTSFEKLFRNHFGQVSPVERAMDRYVQDTLGLRPEYAGQIVQLDGSELPVHVLQGWGRARKDGDLAHVFAALTDAASLRTWLHGEGTTSEVYLWSPLLVKFFEAEGFAPELIIADEGGRGFNALRHQHTDKPLELDPGVRLALAAGVKPYCHRPRNPKGKGAVEAGGIKAAKSTMKYLLAKRFVEALMRELKGQAGAAPANYRTLESEQAWREVADAWETQLNSRLVARVGDGRLTRQGVWDHETQAARRAERALAAGWEERYVEVISRGFVMQHYNGKLCRARTRAELRAPLGCAVPEGAYAVLFPGGLRVGDADAGEDLLRGVIVEGTRGQPQYHAVEALKVRATWLGFTFDQPKLGQHPVGKPETEHDRRRRAWNEAARGMKHFVAARQGTTDEPDLSTGPAIATND